MRVLLVNYWGVPRVGGITRHLLVLKQGLEARGHQVDILSPEPGKEVAWKTRYLYLTDRRFAVDKEPITRLVQDKIAPLYEDIDRSIVTREVNRYTFELAASLFDLEQYDIVHAHDVITARTIARIRPRGIPLVATVHGLLTAEQIVAGTVTKGSLTWDYVALEERLGVLSADRTLAPSQWVRRYLSETHNLLPNSIQVIPYGLDTRMVFPPEARHLDPNTPVKGDRQLLLCPARLTAEKGHKHLLFALAHLLRRRDDFVCWLAGGGGLQRSLEAQVRDLGLQDIVHFLGVRNDIPALLAMADLVVLPSVLDSMPYALIEAQIAGKAVVASRAGGIPEMIQDGVTGVLTSPTDAEGLAMRLDELLSNPDLRLRLGRRAALWGSKYWDAQTMVDRVLAVYQDVAARPAGESFFRKQPGEKGEPVTQNRPIFAPDPSPTAELPNNWRDILWHLPPGYQIPDPAFLATLKPHQAAQQLWPTIAAALPRSYRIPDPEFYVEMLAWQVSTAESPHTRPQPTVPQRRIKVRATTGQVTHARKSVRKRRGANTALRRRRRARPHHPPSVSPGIGFGLAMRHRAPKVRRAR